MSARCPIVARFAAGIGLSFYVSAFAALSPLFKLGHPAKQTFSVQASGYGALAEDRSHVAVYVSRKDSSQIRRGQKAWVVFSPFYSGQRSRPVEGSVESILKGADPRSGQAIVTLRVPRQDLPSRSYAHVRVQLSSYQALAVPATATIVERGKTYVVRQKSGGESDFEKREVQVGQRQPDYTEIRSGLNPADSVLIEGALEWANKTKAGPE